MHVSLMHVTVSLVVNTGKSYPESKQECLLTGGRMNPAAAVPTSAAPPPPPPPPPPPSPPPPPPPRPQEWSTHNRLMEFTKTALIKIFVFPYAAVCELFCGGRVPDADKWDEAPISHYIGIDVGTSGIGQIREAWESLRKEFASEFYEIDPCLESLEPHLQENSHMADVVFCMQHLQMCFESEEKARTLLHNVSSLLKPGCYFVGIAPDSSTIWAKYQKNVEAYHNRSAAMKANIVPNCIRSESYMITFEVEEEKFPLFGKKYQLKFASEASAETHCLVHFPSFIRLAREAGLEYVEIQNLTEFYDDNRAQFAGLMMKSGPNLVDPRGKLLPRPYDVLGLYTIFVFQKPDPDMSAWQGSEGTSLNEDEKNGAGETPHSNSRGKNCEQKGILGPGPPQLRFSDPI
ncbi:mRNA cap guanine-N7 methyltransferase 2-like protein [Drosera capensis]